MQKIQNRTELANDTSARRQGWVDVARVAACVMVVFAHACDGFVGAFDTDRTSFLWGVSLGSLTRPCVPLFVMMTAVLLLPMPQGQRLGEFYRRRIGRVIVPLVFWSLLLPALFTLYYGVLNPATVNPMVDSGGYTLGSYFNKVWMMVFNFNFDTVPLWYLYMLVGLYMVVPVINSWLIQATREEVRTVLMLWGVSLLLPMARLLAPHVGYPGVFGNMDLLGACDWNAYGTFYYFSGFIGYMILAYYLRRWPLQWSVARKWAVLAPMFVAGYAVTCGGFIYIQTLHPGDYAYLEVIWYFCGLNVAMMTVPVFVALSSLRVQVRPWLTRLASLTFGVYLSHFVFVYTSYDLFAWPWLSPGLRIVLMAAFGVACGFGVTWLLWQWRPTRRLVA